MNSIVRILVLPVMLAVTTGCGYLIQVNKRIEYQTIELGRRRGDLWKSGNLGCQVCTENFLISNWGEPSSRTVDSDGITVFTYSNGLRWVGASPVMILPLPLFIPSGKEEIIFGIKDGCILYVRHDTVRRMFFYFPLIADNNITGNIYDANGPSSGCIFNIRK